MAHLARQAPDALEVLSVDWSPPEANQTHTRNYLTMPDLVKTYAYLIDVEGQGYSGRLKMLLHSNRPVLLQRRP
ncbi:MAG: hypothetical protein EOO77_34290 [Oxalobacteraceae bacterium]|nr:MAG: hypothetical protein EOO77_34290 [Oxalobacteraceae bacterium]